MMSHSKHMMMRLLTVTGLLVLAGCGATLVGSGDAPARQDGTSLKITPVVSGLEAPVYLTAAPGDARRLYVVEKPGRIRTIQGGRVTGTFLDIRGRVGDDGSEQGLLSVAFHPRYATNGLFYVNYTDVNGDTRVVEYRKRPGKSPTKRRQLLYLNQPYANHNGGQLQFGPDGYLYVGNGDGGSANDPGNRAQSLSSLLGKLLRIDVDRAGATWEIVGYGLRNPWRFSFDRLTGDLTIGDVGQNEWEEIDYVPKVSPGLENYGWDAYEGNHEFEPEDLNDQGTLVPPIYEYSHEDDCSVTGGYVYRGTGIPSIRGRYFFADFCSGRVTSFVIQNGSAADVRIHGFKVAGISSFGEGPGGELYLVALAGTVYRLAS